MLLDSWCVLVLSAVHPMSPWNHQALVSLRADLKLRVLMETGLGDKLEKAAGGFMDELEAKTVREQPGSIKQMDKAIDILLGKADKDFTAFLKMLRDSNNKVWAEELEKKAEQFREEGTLCVQREGTNQRCTHAVLTVGAHPHLCAYLCVCVCACIRVCVHVCTTPPYVCVCSTAGGECASTLLEVGQSGCETTSREDIELRSLRSKGEGSAGTTRDKVSMHWSEDGAAMRHGPTVVQK